MTPLSLGSLNQPEEPEKPKDACPTCGDYDGMNLDDRHDCDDPWHEGYARLEPKRRGHVELYNYETGTGEIVWDWRLVGGNGEIMCESHQGYTEHNDAAEGFLRCQYLMEYRTLEIRDA